MNFCLNFKTFAISNFCTAGIRYLEHLLSRTFAILNFLAGPFKVQDNERRLYIRLRDGKFFPFLIKTIFNKSFSLLHIAYNNSIYYTLFYQKLIYQELGLAWFKAQDASRAAIIFLTKFSYVEN